jgi:uncharacterized protein
MARNFIRLLSVAFVVATLTGCGTSAQPKFYSLSTTATAGAAPSVPMAILVGPVSVPAAVDRPQFVVQKASNRVDIDEFNRWSAPLGESIARVVAGDLSVQLGTPNVATAPLANFNPDYQVTMNVQRFDTVQGQGAIVEVVWVARKTVGGETRTGRAVANETVQGQGYEALAAAHSRALAQVSAEIADAIRAEASAKQ